MRPRFLYAARQGLAGRYEEVARRLAALLPHRYAIGDDALFLSTDCSVIDLPAIEGCLIGRLYSANGRDGQTELSMAEQLAIMSSGGRSLIEQHCGAYVAIWRGAGDRQLTVLRDPSACLPAWMTTDASTPLIASDAECLHLSGLWTLDPDPGGLAQTLAFPWVPSARTCLAGLHEVRPGFRAEVGSRQNAEAVWHPASYVRDGFADPSSIADAIDNVVVGQTFGSTSIAIELSGGLDSSIVAASVGKGRPCTAIHMVPAAPDGDERRYAHLVVERFGMNLKEVPIAFEDIDFTLRPQRLTARPTNAAHYRIMNAKLHDARRAAQATRLLSGAGGDSVFCSLASTGLILDAWHDRGLPGARLALADLASVAGVTHWEASAHLLRRLWRARSADRRWSGDLTLLGAVGRAASSPDTQQLEGLRPGARAHAASILRIQTMLDIHDRIGDGDMQFPLMAQPVLEACLAVASWRWIAGGRNRAVAREAFAERLPDAILQRTGKARYDTLLLRAYDRARPSLRDLLLGGWLASQHIIEEAAVARALDTPVSDETTYGRLTMLADAELWCRMILDRKGEAGTR